jgi:hypothetical protein
MGNKSVFVSIGAKQGVETVKEAHPEKNFNGIKVTQKLSVLENNKISWGHG